MGEPLGDGVASPRGRGEETRLAAAQAAPWQNMNTTR